VILTYRQRQAHWNWCREFLDRECHYRVDENHPKIPSKAPGGFYVWQGYLRRATLNPHFAHRLGLLFWDRFLATYQQQPFQICACEPSGITIGMIISTAARRLGLPLNVFIARREPKSFGFGNWFDGAVLPKLPVMIVDDVAASAPFMLHASARVRIKLGLPLHYNYFAVMNKAGIGIGKDFQHTENYLDIELVTFFNMNNICKSAEAFRAQYGTAPNWTGLVK
jgi:orotate phosphoribosyltransferase